MPTTYTSLNDRARGWLRFTWDKTTTPDDWSSAGEPLDWWDRDSTAPMCAFPRFDLGETGYPLLLMADVTPAWREVYERIALELCRRHTSFWSSVDNITLIGEDPNVDRYPPEWQVFMPERLRGRYAPPGWVGNGVEPWGLTPDPIGADGNVFVRGFFNLLLSVYRSVSGRSTFDEPFQVTGYRDRQFTWTHPEMAQFISAQLGDRPEGPHCENTKIWPFCVSATGLGLKLYDATQGTRLQNPYDQWVEYARQHYMGLTRRGELDWFALYYDPVKHEACTMPDNLTGYMSLCVVPYVLPQQPEWGRRLYEMSMRLLGWSDPRARINQFHPDPRFLSIALFMANELGDTVTYDRLAAVAERDFEPRFFGEEDTSFGYFFGWGERWPRGQPSALLMTLELGGPGSWTRAFNAPNLTKFDEPTVEGIEFPTLGVSSAHNDPATGELHVSTYAAAPSARGRSTTWRITNLPVPDDVRITCDGQAFEAWRKLDDATIELAIDIDEHDLIVATHPRSAGDGRASRAAAGDAAPFAGPVSSAPNGRATSCSCCSAPAPSSPPPPVRPA